jgi:alkylation response protein AidB-like acyl-CoA dehydrogenase
LGSHEYHDENRRDKRVSPGERERGFSADGVFFGFQRGFAGGGRQPKPVGMIDDVLVARARQAAAVIAPLAARIEAERRLPGEAVAALVAAGAFKMLVPRALGGAETTVPTMIAALEAVARADGSAGWCAMIGATSGLMSVFLDAEVARAIYAPPDAITSGVFAPMGRASPVAGGFRVTGRWPFSSGCEHAQWRMGGAIVHGLPPLPSGTPDVRSMLFEASETRVQDTWDVSGLRGTGSHDDEVTDVFVPAARSFSLLTGKPTHAAPLYAVPFFGVLASGIAAVALGIARASIDALVALAKAKHPLGAKRSIAHRDLVQLQVAQAEAKVRAARAFLLEAAESVTHQATAHGEATLEGRAILRLAASHATTEAAAAVDLMYDAGGASSIYAKNPLQRHFRDVHVATQHVMVSTVNTTLAARVLLDVESDTSTL